MKDFLLVIIDLDLLEFLLFLLLDNSHELVSLLSSLETQESLLLSSLGFSSYLHVLQNSEFLLMLFSFLCSGMSLRLLKGSLSSESIDFSLSIGSLLLKLSEPLDFLLLLFLLSLLLLNYLFFSLSFLCVLSLIHI